MPLHSDLADLIKNVRPEIGKQQDGFLEVRVQAAFGRGDDCGKRSPGGLKRAPPACFRFTKKRRHLHVFAIPLTATRVNPQREQMPSSSQRTRGRSCTRTKPPEKGRCFVIEAPPYIARRPPVFRAPKSWHRCTTCCSYSAELDGVASVARSWFHLQCLLRKCRCLHKDVFTKCRRKLWKV